MRINNQTGCPSKTGKSPKRWMVYTNKNHVQYIHRTLSCRFAYICYQDNSPGCVTNLLNSLQWESLQQRRRKQSLVMCYKIHDPLIAIEPANYYTAGDSRTRGNHRLRQIRAKDTDQHSFFPRSIREWNQVPSSVVDAGSLEDFKVRFEFHPLAFITTQINDRAAVRCICCVHVISLYKLYLVLRDLLD